MSNPKLIAVDWGTSSLRIYAVGDKRDVLEALELPQGILTVTDQGFEAGLQEALALLAVNAEEAPVILSGMIGSRQGWVEAPYVKCPATIDDLAARTVSVDNALGRAIKLVPGLETRSSAGCPDVIRGEETQIFGALAALKIKEGRFVLPGTHSKWVTVTDSQIESFQTYMTGEVFSALKEHTILGRMMFKPGNDKAFERGVAASTEDGAPGRLLNQIFATRTLGLFGEVTDEEAASYLSGLLIGSEIRDGARDHKGLLYIMAGSTLSDRYVRAAHELSLQTRAIDPGSVVQGHCSIAEAAGI